AFVGRDGRARLDDPARPRRRARRRAPRGRARRARPRVGHAAGRRSGSGAGAARAPGARTVRRARRSGLRARGARPVGRGRRRRARAHAARQGALRPLRDLQPGRVRRRDLMATEIEDRVGAFDDVRPPEPSLIEDCVHCGFCLPTCPTYALWDEEMDSPRGRILLMRAAHEEGPDLVASQVQAWDNCLGCMACVTACPSGVQYHKLIEDTRAQVERRYERPRLERLKRRAPFWLFPYPARLRAVAPFSPLARFVPRLGRLAPRVSPREALRRLPERTPARGTRRGSVGFLQGCVQRVFFGRVNRATVEVLAAEGFDVFAPARPGCCGALELHTGWADAARERARRTIAAFEHCETVVVNAAGCGSSMKDYG